MVGSALIEHVDQIEDVLYKVGTCIQGKERARNGSLTLVLLMKQLPCTLTTPQVPSFSQKTHRLYYVKQHCSTMRHWQRLKQHWVVLVPVCMLKEESNLGSRKHHKHSRRVNGDVVVTRMTHDVMGHVCWVIHACCCREDRRLLFSQINRSGQKRTQRGYFYTQRQTLPHSLSFHSMHINQKP